MASEILELYVIRQVVLFADTQHHLSKFCVHDLCGKVGNYLLECKVQLQLLICNSAKKFELDEGLIKLFSEKACM